MKYYLKSLIVFIVLFLSFNATYKAGAEYPEYERSERFIEGTKCPESGNPGLISICGRVTYTLPKNISSPGDTVPTWAANQPAKGVSVYLYECDNTSPTCKEEGNIVRPFSSTLTNDKGLFHLVARKIEDKIPVIVGDEEIMVPANSKRRYLIFNCGSKFAGMKNITSYIDLTESVWEVDCQDTDALEYVGPMANYKVHSKSNSVAAQMGVKDTDEENYYPPQYPEKNSSSTEPDGYHVATEISYDEVEPGRNASIYLNLLGADPRFTKPNQDTWKSLVITAFDSTYPKLGAWWSLDCSEKYKETDWDELCAINREGETVTSKDPDEYEKLLYESQSYLTENLLPNIPPKSNILFYKEFSPRQDLTAVGQDPSDIARYNSNHYGNSLGPVITRSDFGVLPQTYIDCEYLRRSGETISSDTGFMNYKTYGGPGSNLQNPASYDLLIQEMNPLMPVCLIPSSSQPVKLGEIEPPKANSSDKYILDNSYWNPQLLFYIGSRNTATKENFAMGTREASYVRLDKDESPFAAKEENLGVPVSLYTAIVHPSNTIVYGINSGEASSDLTSNTDPLRPNISMLASPIRFYSGTNQEMLKAQTGLKKELYAEGEGYSFAYTELTKSMPVYSGLNIEDASEKIITTNTEDDDYYNDRHFDLLETANENHYTSEDLTGVVDKTPRRASEEKRTPFSAIYFTSAAVNRIEALANTDDDTNRNDALDSYLTTRYGEGNLHESWLGEGFLSGFLDSLKDFFKNLIGGKNTEKTFFDRSTAGRFDLSDPNKIDSLKVYGFEVNEENFRELFPLPLAPPKGMLLPEDWGADQGCYPWSEVDWAKKCETFKNEPYSDGVSRTCRVDECHASTTTKKCTCTRTPTGSGYTYNRNCSKTFNLTTDTPSCDKETYNDANLRLICARKQVTCYIKNWEAENKWVDIRTCIYANYPIELDIKCDEEAFKDVPDDINVITESRTIDTPACIMSIAGPNTCDGDLFRNSSVKLDQKGNDPGTGMRVVGMDDTVYQSISEAFAWANPASVRLTSFSGQFQDHNSSVRLTGNTDPRTSIITGDSEPLKDLSKGLETFGPGDGEGGAYRRALFSHPLSNVGSEFEPIYTHCNSGTMGGYGSWDCGVTYPPDPEIVNIDSLPVNNKCGLNFENEECKKLLLGTEYLDDGFSETFVKMMGAAGTRFGVPASIIMAYQKGVEGSGTESEFEYSYYWTKDAEQELIDLSAPWYGGFDFRQVPGSDCNDVQIPEQGPFDWILNWFGDVLINEGGEGALNELAERRALTASRCNMLDASYVTSAALGFQLDEDKYCSTADADWETVWVPRLKGLTFGVDPVGVYGTSVKYARDSIPYQVYAACSN